MINIISHNLGHVSFKYSIPWNALNLTIALPLYQLCVYSCCLVTSPPSCSCSPHLSVSPSMTRRNPKNYGISYLSADRNYVEYLADPASHLSSSTPLKYSLKDGVQSQLSGAPSSSTSFANQLLYLGSTAFCIIYNQTCQFG